MKRSITRIINIGILLMLLAGSFAWAEPVNAGVSEWSAETIPSTVNNMIGPPGIDIRDYAVASDNKTIYAVPGDSAAGPPFNIYKSVNAGVTWASIIRGVGVQADLIAVALDNNNFVVYADNTTPEIYLSSDGGTTWTPMSFPAAAPGFVIQDIAISPARGSLRYIAVAGRTAVNVGDLWYYTLGELTPAWRDTNNPADGFLAQTVVAALAFSPNFAADAALVAVTGNLTAGVNLQLLSFSPVTPKWNTTASFIGYPCNVVSANITQVCSASLSLTSGYDATTDTSRNLFIGLTLDGNAAAVAASGVYRLVDTVSTGIITNKQIHSVAYNGSLLMGGAYDSTTVYRVTSPLAVTPTVTTYATNKSPGGNSRVLLAWAGSTLLAGTCGNESAFSISKDSGATFTDISLIDTALTNLRDVAVTTNAAKVYLVTDDGFDTSLWYQTSGAWTRVLSKQALTDCIVRIEPSSGNIIYLAKKGGVSPTIYYNSTSGGSLWLTRNCTINVQDIAVESTVIVYVLDVSGKITKSTNAGQTWGATTDTELASGNMLYSISTDKLLAGSNDGYVAYTINGTAGWTKITPAFSGPATTMEVIPDQNFATNKIIYAATQTTGQDIQKWQIGVSTVWTDIFSGTVPGGVYGLAMDSNTLYALETNAGQSKLWRYINPSNATATSTDWVSIGVTAASTADAPFTLDAQPQALKVSASKLWAVKTNTLPISPSGNKLFSFTDSVTNITISLGQPANGYISPINTINGHSNDINFSWNRPSVASEYQLFISFDPNFNSISTNVTVSSNNTIISVMIGPNQAAPRFVDFQAGTVYYWKLRTSKPGYSLFSAVRSFSIGALPVLPSSSVSLVGPANGEIVKTSSPSFSWAPLQNGVEYEFVLSAKPDMSSPLMDARVNTTAFQVSRKLDPGKTYFWRVRCTQPIVSDWSPISNFIVEAAVVLPTETTATPVPTYIVSLPPSTHTELVFPPAKNTPVQIVPGYLAIAILIGLALTGAVLYLLLKKNSAKVRVTEGLGPTRHRESVKQPSAPQSRPLGTAPPAPTVEKKLSAQESPKAVWPSAMKEPEAVKTVQPVPEEAAVANAPLTKSKDAATIIFAARSFMWLSAAGTDAAPETPDKEREALGKKIAGKIHDLAKKEPLYLRHPEDAGMLLRLWARYSSGDEVGKYLESALKSRPDNAIRLIKCFLTQGTSANKPSAAGDFNAENYRALAEVIEPDMVYAALNKAEKFKLRGSKEAPHIPAEDSALVSIFMHLHLQEKKTG